MQPRLPAEGPSTGSRAPAGSDPFRSPGAPGRPAAPAALAVGPDGRIVHWSSAAAELLGVPAEEVAGRRVADLAHDDDGRATIAAALAEASAGRPQAGVRAVLRDTAGAPARAVELSCDPMDDGLVAVIVAPARPPHPPAATGPGPDDVPSRTPRSRLALLSEAGARLGSTLDVRRTGAELVGLVLPGLADAACVLVLERFIAGDDFPERAGGGAVTRRIASGAVDPASPGWPAALASHELVTCQPGAPYADCMEFDRTIAFSGGLAVPLRARGTVLGCLVLLRGQARPAFDSHDIALAEDLAARAAVCLDNARLYDRERRTALTLQSSMLPTGLREPLGLEIAHRYLPAGDLTCVGGDWYDAIPLPGGRVALVVGDVMGHGTGAAATMGQLRTAVRALAGLDPRPEDVLHRLDEMIEDMGGAPNATCVYAVYDPVEQTCAVARAGHVPPVVLHPDGRTEILDIPPGLPLGIGGEAFESRTVRLADGCTLVLVTDGLVESRDRDIDAGIEALRETLAGAPRGLEEICDLAVEALRPGDDRADRDDIALLLARVRALPPDRIAATTLPAEAGAARRARRFVRDALAAWGLDGLAPAVVPAVGELVDDAARHGPGPFGVRLLRGTSLVCEVADRSGAAGPDPDRSCTDASRALAGNGRGSWTTGLPAVRRGTRLVPGGRILWCELPLAPPQPHESH
ncbi:SpoIIE family protein phosphatase [Actinomadura rugatobispora]|uniref:SpoIIE family protein phosphatase n=1 Tax=Actinomadura rugatobispora TaxID=1994 RepID=A0ABW1A785_9ACTN|nr:SpoIIE family protein phosphatase [Actinomadura rugatobispora]